MNKIRVVCLFVVLLLAFKINAQQQILLPIKQNGKWGYINEYGNVIIQPVYDYAEDFEEGTNYTKVQLGGNVYGLSRTGQLRDIKIPLTQNGAIKRFKFFLDSFIIDKDPNNELWGMYTLDFKEIYPPQYDSIYLIGNDLNTFSWLNDEGAIVLKQNGLYGIGTTEGKIILPPTYTNIFRTWRKHYQIRLGDSCGLYTSKGEQVLPIIFNTIRELDLNHVIALQNNKGWGIYDKDGAAILGHDWDGIRYLNHQFFLVNKGDSSYLFSLQNKKLFKVDGFIAFGALMGSGLLITTRNGNGIIDTSGKILLEPIYRYVFFSENHWIISSAQRKWGLLNNDGKEVFEPAFDFIDNLQENVALVKKDSLWGIINTSREIVVPIRYKEIDLVNNTAKGKIGNTVDIYTLADDGTLEDSMSYNNVLTIKVQSRSDKLMRRNRNTRDLIAASNRVIGIDTIAYNSVKAWFRDSVSLKWGLRDASGRVIIPPTYDKIETTDSSAYTIVHVNVSPPFRTKIFGTYVEFSSFKGLVDHYHCKILAEPKFLYIDDDILEPWFLNEKIPVSYPTDISNYVTALRQDGTFSIINSKGRIYTPKKIRFADKKYGGKTRVFIGEIECIEKSDKVTGCDECVQIMDFVNRVGGKIVETSARPRHYLNFKKGHWTYIDNTGNLRETPLSKAGNFINQRAIVQTSSGGYGVFNYKFYYHIQPYYSYISYLPRSSNQQFLLKERNYLESFIDTNGQMITGFVFKQTQDMKEGRAWVADCIGNMVYTADKFSMIDTNGFKVGDVKFVKARPFKSGLAAVSNGNLWGFINPDGDTVVPMIYRKVGDFADGVAWVNLKGKIGYVDTEGEVIIPPKYRKAGDFVNGFAWVIVEGKYGFIDKSGELVIPAIYSKVSNFSTDGFSVATKGKKVGVIDKTGNWVVASKYKEIKQVTDGIYLASKRKKHWLVNIVTGEIKRLPRYSRVIVNSDGILEASKRNSKTDLIDVEGKPVTAASIGNFYKSKEGLIIAGSGKNKGVINYDGDTILPFENRKVEFLGEQLIKVLSRDRSWSIANTKGEAVSCCYQAVTNYVNGFAFAQNNEGKWGLINTNGIWVSKPSYDRVYQGSENFFRVGVSEMQSITDLNGKFITNGSFESISYIKEVNLYKVVQRSRVGYITPKGEWIWRLEQ